MCWEIVKMKLIKILNHLDQLLRIATESPKEGFSDDIYEKFVNKIKKRNPKLRIVVIPYALFTNNSIPFAMSNASHPPPFSSFWRFTISSKYKVYTLIPHHVSPCEAGTFVHPQALSYLRSSLIALSTPWHKSWNLFWHCFHAVFISFSRVETFSWHLLLSLC